jgi:hypothetical protein
MTTLARLGAAARESWRRHQRKQKLRRELAEYRTPAERAELEAILARYDTTVGEILRSVDRPAEPDLPEPAAGLPPLELFLIPEQRRG